MPVAKNEVDYRSGANMMNNDEKEDDEDDIRDNVDFGTYED